MKNFLLTLLTLPLLIGCSAGKNVIGLKEENKALDYSNFSELKIEWNSLFLPAKSQYFVYIYSISCLHCEKIKPDVLSYVNADKEHFYLIEYSEEIPIGMNASLTIGKEEVEEIFILGTPTLLEISNHFLALNIAGEKEIVDYLSLLPHNDCYGNLLFQ